MTTSAHSGNTLLSEMVRAASDHSGTSAGKSLKFVAWRPFLRDMQQHLADLDARWGLGAAEAQSPLAEQLPAEAEQVRRASATCRAGDLIMS